MESNPNAVKTISHDTIFTNVAKTPDGNVWWEGIDGDVPPALTDWKGKAWDPSSTEKAAHPNSRFTAPATNNPALSRFWDDPTGVPISAVIFGGRRASTIPLVMQAFNWMGGVFYGATLGSETTAAATGKVGVVRRDPFAMLPFCGYNMGRYFQHWLDMQANIQYPPKVFLVNWFRKGRDGKSSGPASARTCASSSGSSTAPACASADRRRPSAGSPRPATLDLSGLDISSERVDEATHIDLDEWKTELESAGEFFKQIGPTLPSRWSSSASSCSPASTRCRPTSPSAEPPARARADRRLRRDPRYVDPTSTRPPARRHTVRVQRLASAASCVTRRSAPGYAASAASTRSSEGRSRWLVGSSSTSAQACCPRPSAIDAFRASRARAAPWPGAGPGRPPGPPRWRARALV